MARVIEIKSGADLEELQIAQEISEREDFSNVIINASLDGIITYDLQVRYTLWSPQMEKLTGLKKENVLGRNAFELFPFLKEAGIDKVVEKTFHGESVQSAVMRYEIPETGQRGYTQQQNFPLYNEAGEITGGMAIIRDVTAMKEKFENLLINNRLLETRLRELESSVGSAHVARKRAAPMHHRLSRQIQQFIALTRKLTY